jgi:DNA invertase Pin-like site-specific DNA recombinase
VFTVESGEVLPDDEDDPVRTAMRQMIGVFFQLERAMLLKRMKNGRAEKARQGGYIGGAVPFGRRVVDGEFADDEAEQLVIARARELGGGGCPSRGSRRRWRPRTSHQERHQVVPENSSAAAGGLTCR